MRMGNKPDGMTTRFAPAMAGRAKPKPARRSYRAALVIVAAFIAIAVSGTIFARWPKAAAPAPAVAKKEPAAPQKLSGHVIISRTNSELCDRYLFDNVTGTIKPVETLPCSSAGKRPDVNIADQVNSFSSHWRGAK
jgi:hypothetical protein